MSTYLSDNSSNSEYIVELLHYALAYGDQDAWVEVQQCLDEAVRDWLHRHPNRETAHQLEKEEYYIALAFERFRQAAIDRQIECSTLATALRYVRMSLNAAILDRLRASSQPHLVALPPPGSPEKLFIGSATSGAEVWKHLQSILLNDHEQRLAYLLFCCGMEPEKIIRSFSQEFGDIHEIYHLRHHIIERLLFACPQQVLTSGMI